MNGVPGFFNQGAGVWLRKPNQIPTRHYLQSGDSVRVRQGQDDLGVYFVRLHDEEPERNYPSILRGLPLGSEFGPNQYEWGRIVVVLSCAEGLLGRNGPGNGGNGRAYDV